MARGVRISPKNKTIKPLKKYLEPKKVYIPLIIHNDDNITILVKKGDKVLKGEMVAKSKGDFRTPIHASVSGEVLDFTEMYYLNGRKVKCVVIENDLEEKIKDEKINHFKNYTKETAVQRIKENGVIGLSGSGFPAYIKYDNKLNTLIVNAVESDPYTTADSTMLIEKCEEILETIDGLVDIFNIKEAIIAVKKNNFKIKEKINNFIGSYTKLKMVEMNNYYSIGWEKELIRKIKRINCKSFPTKDGIVVSNVSTIYAIYEALKYDRPLVERMVSFSGDKLKESLNLYLKIGTPINEVIEFLGGEKEADKMIITNGPMMGYSVESDQLVVSSDLTSVWIVNPIIESKISSCFRCGECVAVCPVKLSPILIKEATEFENLHPERCIDCGLCSYICPAKINIRQIVREAKEKMYETKNN